MTGAVAHDTRKDASLGRDSKCARVDRRQQWKFLKLGFPELSGGHEKLGIR